MKLVYCDRCGLLMSNGFCLHGSVEAAREREAKDEMTYARGMAVDRFLREKR